MKDEPADLSRYRVQALAKGLAVLVAIENGPATVSALARQTGLQMGTVFRVVATLAELGFVEKLTDGSYAFGIAAKRLGAAAIRSSSLLEASRRALKRLADDTGQTVNLGVLDGDQVLYLARLRNADLVTANVQVGSTLPAPYTSIGKALLARLPPSEVRSRLGPASFPSRAGPNALRDATALEVELEGVRARGFATQYEELAAGLCSIAVAVVPTGGSPVAAVNVAMASTGRSVDSLVADYASALEQAATEIAMTLEDGWTLGNRD